MKRNLPIVVLLISLGLSAILRPVGAFSTWTQTDWSTGDYESIINLDVGETGQVSLEKNEELTNGDFETDLTGWSPNVNWWEAGGATGAVAVYQPLGATSLADSYVNLANPGTYDAAPGTAPAWDAATGWTFVDASSQYLTTGIVPENDQSWSMLARFNGVSLADQRSLAGVYNGAAGGSFYIRILTTAIRYGNGGIADVAPALTSGTLSVSGNQGYRNGAADGGAMAAWSVPSTAEIYIGTYNSSGAPSSIYFEGVITALAIYDETLSADENLAIHNEVSTSMTQVSRDTTITYDGSAGSMKTKVQGDQEFVQSVDVGDTEGYYLETYAYTDGTPVTAADAELYYNGSSVATTYTDAGSGWYKLSADVTGIAAATDYGVEVKAGKTAYLDDISLYQYEDTGSLTSSIHDTGQESEWGTVEWTESGTGGTLEVRVRTSDSSTMAGATDWSLCNAVTSGADLTDNNCVTDGDRYVQYHVSMTAGSTPVLEEISINYDVVAEEDENEDDAAGELDETGQAISAVLLVGAISLVSGFTFAKKKDKRSS